MASKHHAFILLVVVPINIQIYEHIGFCFATN